MDIETELTQAIVQTVNARTPRELADHVLTRDGREIVLVGVTHGGSAIAWVCGMSDLLRVELPRSGRRLEIESELIEKIHTLGQLERWIRNHPEGLRWVHPRFRWLVEDFVTARQLEA